MAKEFVSINSLSKDKQEKIKEAVELIVDDLTLIAASRDKIKTVLDDISEDTGVEKKIIRKIAKVYYNSNFEEEKENFSTFEDFYEKIIKE